jgi:hypothetical protein
VIDELERVQTKETGSHVESEGIMDVTMTSDEE